MGGRAKEKKRQRKYGPGVERLLFIPSLIAWLLRPFQTSWQGVFLLPPCFPPPPLGEPGRSHRLRKGGLGGDSRRGSRQARVRGGLELIASIWEVV